MPWGATAVFSASLTPALPSPHRLQATRTTISNPASSPTSSPTSATPSPELFSPLMSFSTEPSPCLHLAEHQYIK
ncbi:hypothetical protein FF1_012980 [Malus domestica]